MPQASALDRYLAAFARLHTDRNSRRWPDATRNQAPHKPLFLLSVLDLFDAGRVTANRIVITPDLLDLFSAYWSRVMPPGQRSNLAYPFFYLRSEGFWHLVPMPDKAALLNSLSQVSSLRRLSEVVQARR